MYNGQNRNLSIFKKIYILWLVLAIFLICSYLLTSCFLKNINLNAPSLKYNESKELISWGPDGANEWEYKLSDSSSNVLKEDILKVPQISLKTLREAGILSYGEKYKIIVIAGIDNKKYKSKPAILDFTYKGLPQTINVYSSYESEGSNKKLRFSVANNEFYDGGRVQIYYENEIQPFSSLNFGSELTCVSDVFKGVGKYRFDYQLSDSKGKFQSYVGKLTTYLSQDYIDECNLVPTVNNKTINEGIIFKLNNSFSKFVLDTDKTILVEDANKKIVIEPGYISYDSLSKTIKINKDYFDTLEIDERGPNKTFNIIIPTKKDGVNYHFRYSILVTDIVDNVSPRIDNSWGIGIPTFKIINDIVNIKLRVYLYKRDISTININGTIITPVSINRESGSAYADVIIKNNFKEIFGFADYAGHMSGYYLQLNLSDSTNLSMTFNLEIYNNVFETGFQKNTYYTDVSKNNIAMSDTKALEVRFLSNSEPTALNIFMNGIQLGSTDYFDYATISSGEIDTSAYLIRFKIRTAVLNHFAVGESIPLMIKSNDIKFDNSLVYVKPVTANLYLKFKDIIKVNDGSEDLELKVDDSSTGLDPVGLVVGDDEYSVDTSKWSVQNTGGKLSTLILKKEVLRELTNGYKSVGIRYRNSSNSEFTSFTKFLLNKRNWNELKLARVKSNKYEFLYDLPLGVSKIQIKNTNNSKTKTVNIVDRNDKIYFNPGTDFDMTKGSSAVDFELKTYDISNAEINTKTIPVKYLASNYDRYLDAEFNFQGKSYNLFIETEEQFTKLIHYIIAKGNNFKSGDTYEIIKVNNIVENPSGALKVSSISIPEIYIAIQDKTYSIDEVRSVLYQNAINKLRYGYSIGLGISGVNPSNRFSLSFDCYSTTNAFIGGNNKQYNKRIEDYVAYNAKETANTFLGSKRPSSYNNFKYLSYPLGEGEATTGVDVMSTLENGLRPNVKAGSQAEEVVNKAHDVLRNYIMDSMTEYEKVIAIFQWINRNIYYDYQLIEQLRTGGKTAAEEQYYKYSYEAEGAFLGKGAGGVSLAVCDGISKAFSILCNMEGIKCERRSGYTGGNENSKHAWNKVKIGDYWYMIDATWGMGLINNGIKKEEGYFEKWLLANDNAYKYPTSIKDKHELEAINDYKKLSCLDTLFDINKNKYVRYGKTKVTDILNFS